MSTVSMDDLSAQRLVIAGPIPPPMGGMALQTQQLLRCLMNEGLSVVLVPCNPELRPAFLNRIPVLRALLKLFAYRRHLHRALRDADLVHVMANSGWSWYLFAVPAIHIADKYGCAVIVNYRGGLAESFLAKAIKRVRYSMHRVDQLIVPTAFLQGVFARYRWAAEIIPNILDERQFKPIEQANAQLVITVTRNLEALYDNASAIRAFAEVKKQVLDAQLILCGEGPERERLAALAAELDVLQSVRFAGRLPRPELLAVLAATRVLLNPSRADNSPNSLIEAMASGIPIVSTNVGGIPVLCQHQEHALLVEAGDHKAMAEAILQLHHGEDLRQQLIDNGHKKAREFFWSSVRQRLYRVYQTALTQRKQRHA